MRNDIRKWESILEVGDEFSVIISILKETPFVSLTVPLARMNRRTMLKVLEKVQSGNLSIAQFQNWAEAIEMREEWAFEDPDDEVLVDFFYEISNKDLFPDLGMAEIDAAIARLCS